MAGSPQMLLEKDDMLLDFMPDRYGYNDVYKNCAYFERPETVISIAKARQNEFDYIVIKEHNELLHEFPNAIMLWAGSKLRAMKEGWDKFALLMTPDLTKQCHKGKVIGIPIDFDMFHDMNLNREREWYSIVQGYQHEQRCQNTRDQYPDCKFRNRSTHHIPYSTMPILLNVIKNYIDCKYDYGNPMEPLYNYWSGTAMQAAACGCDVYSHNKVKYNKKLLKEHDRKLVTRRLKRCLETL